MPEEDGIIKCYAKLKHGSYRLRDVANLPEEIVCTKVPQNSYRNTEQKDNRKEKAIHRNHQNNHAQGNCNRHINSFLLLHKLFRIRYHSGKTGHKAFFSGKSTDCFDCFHSLFCGRRRVKEHCSQHAVSILEDTADFFRQNFCRQRAFRERRISQNCIHMRNFFQALFQLCLLNRCQSIGHQQGECSFSEILHQNFLSFYGFKVLRQIIQKIIFCFRGCHSHDGGDQQQQTQDNHRNTVTYQPFCKSFQCNSPHLFYFSTPC